jgi:hypothetical protein
MNQIIASFNKMLLNGMIPNQLNYKEQKPDEIDWDKVRYNSFYRSFEFTEQKFPPGHECIPGFDKVIESCIPTKSPLQEIEERSQVEKQIIEQ